MRQTACFILVLLILTVPYDLGKRSVDALLSGTFPLELTAGEVTASSMFAVGSVDVTPTRPAAAADVWAGNAAPPVMNEDADAATIAAEDWFGTAGRPPVVLTHPNPFTASTEIAYTLPHATNAIIKVYNAVGREVARLTDGYREEGTYVVRFDGSRLEPGLYVCVLETASTTVAEEIVLSR